MLLFFYAHSAWSSWVVSHLSTNRARPRSASEASRDRAPAGGVAVDVLSLGTGKGMSAFEEGGDRPDGAFAGSGASCRTGEAGEVPGLGSAAAPTPPISLPTEKQEPGARTAMPAGFQR